MRYKTRPGLSYHMSHSHNKIVPPEEDDLPITYHQAPRPHPLPPTIDCKECFKWSPVGMAGVDWL